jgi:hypothetical protein
VVRLVARPAGGSLARKHGRERGSWAHVWDGLGARLPIEEEIKQRVRAWVADVVMEDEIDDTKEE